MEQYGLTLAQNIILFVLLLCYIPLSSVFGCCLRVRAKTWLEYKTYHGARYSNPNFQPTPDPDCDPCGDLNRKLE